MITDKIKQHNIRKYENHSPFYAKLKLQSFGKSNKQGSKDIRYIITN